MKNSKVLVLLCLAVFVQPSFADDRIVTGMELDVLPFATGGYYASVWGGKDSVRARAIIASVNVPDTFVKSGFENNSLDAFALVVDYFPKGHFDGLWVGAGLEYWDSSIESSSTGAKADFENYVLTAGGGYVWYFHERFYLNPWGAVHYLARGDKRVDVGNEVYKPDALTGEVSLKLGWVF